MPRRVAIIQNRPAHLYIVEGRIKVVETQHRLLLYPFRGRVY